MPFNNPRGPSGTSRGSKRRASVMVASSSTGESYANPIDLEDDDDVLVVGSRPRRRVRARRNLTPPNIADARSSQQLSNSETAAPAEERVKPFREMPPTGFAARRERALSQRLYVLARERRLSAAGTHEEELIEISGSTGKPYEVTISKLLKCSCPDHYIRRDLCKHIIYVLVNVLKAPPQLQYQLALLSSELAEIFVNAPDLPQSADGSTTDTTNAGKRKPIEGDCPICVLEFEAGEDVVWCKAACGNNVHKACFDQWANRKQGAVTCVYCRQPWKAN